jgi:hypothetical protein
MSCSGAGRMANQVLRLQSRQHHLSSLLSLCRAPVPAGIQMGGTGPLDTGADDALEPCCEFSVLPVRSHIVSCLPLPARGIAGGFYSRCEQMAPPTPVIHPLGSKANKLT